MTREILPAQAPEGSPDSAIIDAAWNAMANSPAKLLTYTALACRPGELVNGRTLANDLRDAQGNDPGWLLDRDDTAGYCEQALNPHFASVHGETYTAIRSPLVVLGALATVGTLLDHNLTFYNHNTQSSLGARAGKSTTLNRLGLYAAILASDSAESTIVQISEATRRTPTTVSALAEELIKLDVLQVTRQTNDTSSQRLELRGAPSDFVQFYAHAGQETQDLYALFTELAARGMTSFSFGDVARWLDVRGASGSGNVQKTLSRLIRNSWSAFITTEPLSVEARSKLVGIHPSEQDAISDLLHRYEQVKSSYDTQLEWAHKALDLYQGNPTAVAGLMEKAKLTSARRQHMKTRDIDLDKLVGQVLGITSKPAQEVLREVERRSGMRLNYYHFLALLRTNPNITYAVIPGPTGQQAYVSRAAVHEPIQTSARGPASPRTTGAEQACADIDKTIPPTHQPKIPYETARKICDECSFIRDCLAYTIIAGKNTGFAGGMTPEERNTYIRKIPSALFLAQAKRQLDRRTIGIETDIPMLRRT